MVSEGRESAIKNYTIHWLSGYFIDFDVSRSDRKSNRTGKWPVNS